MRHVLFFVGDSAWGFSSARRPPRFRGSAVMLTCLVRLLVQARGV
jgi:hypothetical protein